MLEQPWSGYPGCWSITHAEFCCPGTGYIPFSWGWGSAGTISYINSDWSRVILSPELTQIRSCVHGPNNSLTIRLNDSHCMAPGGESSSPVACVLEVTEADLALSRLLRGHMLGAALIGGCALLLVTALIIVSSHFSKLLCAILCKLKNQQILEPQIHNLAAHSAQAAGQHTSFTLRFQLCLLYA